MKRFLSLLLLCIVLLNALGYYGVLLVIQQHYGYTASRKIEQSNHEIGGQLIFRIPLRNPYTANTNYVHVNGKLAYEGKVYRLLKQKHHNDTLYVVCMLDDRSTLLADIMSEYAGSFSNESKEHSAATELIVPASKYYLLITTPASFKNTGNTQSHNCVTPFPLLSYVGVRDIFRPPQRLFC